MKRVRLNNIKPLANILETITAMDFRKAPGEILDSVRFGGTFIITRQGKPCALPTSLPGQTLTIKVGKNGEISYGL